jgi:hypothetical protein
MFKKVLRPDNRESDKRNHYKEKEVGKFCRELVGDDPEDKASVRYKHKKAFGVFFKPGSDSFILLRTGAGEHVAVIKEKIEKGEFDHLVSDQTVDKEQLQLRLKIRTRCDLKKTVDANADKRYSKENVKHQPSTLLQSRDEIFHGHPFLWAPL